MILHCVHFCLFWNLLTLRVGQSVMHWIRCVCVFYQPFKLNSDTFRFLAQEIWFITLVYQQMCACVMFERCKIALNMKMLKIKSFCWNLLELLKIFCALDTSKDHFQFVVLQKSKFDKTNAIFVRNIYSFLNVNVRTALWFQYLRSSAIPPPKIHC